MKSIPLAGDRTIALTHPLVMGIINCTPDSFAVSYATTEQAVECARTMIAEGADMLDIGGESSRPGSDPVAADIELERVIPVIEKIREFSSIPLSIDTTKALVAEKALTAGADIINDISALAFDDRMAGVAKAFDCPVVLMHIKGRPKTMQKNPGYGDVIGEIKRYFAERITYAASHGIAEGKLILDVGIGFGKRTEDNLALIKHLDEFNDFGCPILFGASRKRFIGDVTGAGVADRLPGSIVAAAMAVHNGADIVRVHDVAATRQAILLTAAIREV